MIEESSEIHYFKFMERIVTASEANRSFSELLRGVEHGQSVAVTRHGRTVARIVPAEAAETEAKEARARRLQAYLKRAARRPVIDIGRWSRDDLYQR